MLRLLAMNLTEKLKLIEKQLKKQTNLFQHYELSTHRKHLSGKNKRHRFGAAICSTW